MEHKATKELRELIRRRATLLQQQKKAKGKRLETITNELGQVQKRISALDEKQN